MTGFLEATYGYVFACSVVYTVGVVGGLARSAWKGRCIPDGYEMVADLEAARRKLYSIESDVGELQRQVRLMAPCMNNGPFHLDAAELKQSNRPIHV